MRKKSPARRQVSGSTTIDQAKHFGLFMMKAVLDGRATQLVDLAKVNLQR